MSAFGLVRSSQWHLDGRPVLASLFVLPVVAMSARFVNLPDAANDPYFFGPLEG